jgi:hypothetical protein
MQRVEQHSKLFAGAFPSHVGQTNIASSARPPPYNVAFRRAAFDFSPKWRLVT